MWEKILDAALEVREKIALKIASNDHLMIRTHLKIVVRSTVTSR